MKYFFKGIGLGISLNIANRLCDLAFGFQDESLFFFSLLIFCIITTAFLVSDKISNLLLCGVTGLFVMFYCEIFVFHGFASSSLNWFDIYFYGMLGSIAAIFIAFILTWKRVTLSNYFVKDSVLMSKPLKIKLLLYAMISAVSFSYLVLPEQSGIGIPVFAIIQFICLWYVVPNRKKLVWFIPIFLLSLNSFISANTIWKPWNFLICSILFCSMFLNHSFKNDSFAFLTNTVASIVNSCKHFLLPFQWLLELNTEKAPIIKRIVIALAVTIPCVIVLILVLSSADMVFSIKTENILEHLTDLFKFNTILKIICSILVGLFLFGVLYQSHAYCLEEHASSSHLKGDLIIINILLVSILLVYTLFVIIQFRYLFAGATLPEGLSYTAYARKGFFELLALTGVNIALILSVTKITKHHQGGWLTFSKVLCHYLCVVTIVLLISSFYRMLLYTNDDGLTRLRLFVLGFLVFEAIGLLITFLYIAKLNFNLPLVYITLALGYYVLLNLIPTDNIIAKNQIDRYLKGERTDIVYVFTLSADAVPALKYLKENTADPALKYHVDNFIQARTTLKIPERWQRLNLSIEQAKETK